MQYLLREIVQDSRNDNVRQNTSKVFSCVFVDGYLWFDNLQQPLLFQAHNYGSVNLLWAISHVIWDK